MGSQPDGADTTPTGTTRTGAQLRAEAEKRLGDKAADMRLVYRAMTKIEDEWTAAGLTITN